MRGMGEDIWERSATKSSMFPHCSLHMHMLYELQQQHISQYNRWWGEGNSQRAAPSPPGQAMRQLYSIKWPAQVTFSLCYGSAQILPRDRQWTPWGLGWHGELRGRSPKIPSRKWATSKGLRWPPSFQVTPLVVFMERQVGPPRR